MTDYSKVTQQEFDDFLKEILSEKKGDELLKIPGIYEILAEHFNNEVLELWDYRTN